MFSAAWPWRILAGTLILAAAGIRLAYLALACPLDLAPDEAHYWDWSRHLDWSYYSKGPLVACLIRASCFLFGPLSRWLVGSEMLAVRLPAVLCGSLLLVSLYVLTVQVFKRERLALAVVALALTLPVMAVGATVMTIDAPYTCCWGWALVLGYQAVFGGSRWAWPLCGLVVGLGILAKYTMILWLVALALFLLASPRRRLLVRPGFWILATVAAVCCVPILIWNARNGWVTFYHLRGHAGLQETGLRWLGPCTFVAGQFLLLLGYWFIGWLGAMIANRPWQESRPEISYLWWMSAPMFVVFLLFSLKNGGGELNWPVTAYLSGMVLTVAWLAKQLQQRQGGYRLLTICGLMLFGGLGMALTVLLHNSVWFRPLLARLSGPATPDRPFPLRRWDPTCRLRGWRELAAEVDRLRGVYERSGHKPVLAATRWNLAGELGFYCQGNPTVHCLGLALGDRHSQYDLWRPNPVADPGRFAGRTFIIVAYDPTNVGDMFEWVTPARVVTHSENCHAVAQWTIVVGHGFRGCGTRSRVEPAY